MNSYKYSKSYVNSVGGATIIEVMISVFLLTFGILALMAAQIRSVAAVSEASNRTLISQAAESLAEGMLANPGQTKGASGVLTRNYTDYLKPAKKISGSGSTDIPSLATINGATKRALADRQIANFEAVLNAVPDVRNISYAICVDNANNINPPTMNANGTMNANCPVTPRGRTIYIKVAWQTKKQNSNNPNDTVTHTFVHKAATN